jgi:hypothetical protein
MHLFVPGGLDDMFDGLIFAAVAGDDPLAVLPSFVNSPVVVNVLRTLLNWFGAGCTGNVCNPHTTLVAPTTTTWAQIGSYVS